MFDEEEMIRVKNDSRSVQNITIAQKGPIAALITSRFGRSDPTVDG